jgi:hypothetical protein
MAVVHWQRGVLSVISRRELLPRALLASTLGEKAQLLRRIENTCTLKVALE